MNKKKIVAVVLVVLGIIALGVGGYFLFKKEKVEPRAEAIQFKKEYEEYNGKKNEAANKDYLVVSVGEENPIYYKTDAEIAKIMKEEDAIIYFGWATCPWCRNTIEPLFEAAKEQNIDKIYYVDILNIRDSYVYENKKVKQTKKGTDAYYEILDILGDKLSKFYVKDSKGKQHDTKVTRLYAPTVVAISKGKVVAIHEGTIKTQTDPYTALTADQKKELTKEFVNLMKKFKVKTGTCREEDAC